MNEFGNFLYSLRKEKGLTQVELANLLKITNKAVSKWETGEAMPETSLLLPLSKILGVTVDELLNGEKINEDNLEGSEDRTNDSDFNFYNDEGNKKNFSYNSTNKQDNYNSSKSHFDNSFDNKNFEIIKSHIFTRGKENENKTLLEKICGAVCASIFLLSLTTFFFIGIFTNVWVPYWVIIPISALTCGIVGIIFDLFNTQKRMEKIKKGENIYLGSLCGLVILVCIILYLLLGAILNFWHPYWIIVILGVVFCGIAGAVSKIFK